MAQVGQDGELLLLTQQIEALERPPSAKPSRWPWVLITAALLAVAALGVQGGMAYATIARIDGSSNIGTANPITMFQDVATNGPRVGSTVDASNRATYTRALEQFLLAGTGVVVGLVLALAGLFVRANW